MNTPARTIGTFALLLLTTCLSAQPFEVPCPAPDSVVALYQADADRLALERTLRNGTVWIDSVMIDPAWSDIAMNALMAVYNSDLPARDTVVDMLDIHIYPTITMKLLAVTADSTQPWMQQLSMGITPTGTPAVDDLMAAYGVVSTGYSVWPWGAHTAVFETQTNVNIPALCALFAAQPGVFYAEPNGGCCDGSTITDSVHTDHVQLVYSYGWGDCPSGCTLRRFWEFNVFPDCSVEFIGSYGSPLNIGTAVVEHVTDSSFEVYPNPATQTATIRYVLSSASEVTLVVTDIAGHSLVYSALGRQGAGVHDHSFNAEGMASGVYAIRLTSGEGTLLRKLVVDR